MHLHRTLLSLVAIALSIFTITGGRCYAEENPRILSRADLACTLSIHRFCYVAIREEKPVPFQATPDRSAREHRDAVILPKFPVAMAYHPQPAHC